MGPVQAQRLVQKYLDEGRHGQARELLATALTSHPNEQRIQQALEQLG